VPETDVHGKPTYVLAAQLDLAAVQTSADADVDLREGVDDRLGAVDSFDWLA
jgi:hypothetical protein